MKDAGPGLPPGASLATFPALRLDSGAVLRDVRCAYSTYGELNAAGDNVVVVGHSLTSNSCVHEWWGEMLGAGPAFALDTDRDFIVCANYLGSPYGTSSPCTPDPAKRRRDDHHHDDHHASSSISSSSSSFSAWYGADFPTPCTIRDNVRLQKMLLDHLGAKKIRCAVGGSMGAMLALEWGATHPDLVESLVLIAGCGKHTDWAIGIGEAERFAIAADAKYRGGAYDPRDPPLGGLAAARMTAMLTYRAPRSVDDRHHRAREESPPPDAHADAELKVVRRATPGAAGALPHFEVESYLRYQGRSSRRPEPSTPPSAPPGGGTCTSSRSGRRGSSVLGRRRSSVASTSGGRTRCFENWSNVRRRRAAWTAPRSRATQGGKGKTLSTRDETLRERASSWTKL
jgi:homoserine acetyltransferase